jgi:hypothetical protein
MRAIEPRLLLRGTILQGGGMRLLGCRHEVLAGSPGGLIVEKAIAAERQLGRARGLGQEKLVARRVVGSGQPREALAPKSIVCETKADFIFREIRRLADRHNERRLTACICCQRKGPGQGCRAVEN